MTRISIWFLLLLAALLIADFRYAIINFLSGLELPALFALLLAAWYFW